MPELNEPSILDYLKYKLGMIDSLEFPDDTPENEFSAETTSPIDRTSDLSRNFREASFQGNPAEDDEETVPSRFPWRSLLALLNALIGQSIFDLSRNSTPIGIFFYLIAFALLIFAQRKGEWNINSLRYEKIHFPNEEEQSGIPVNKLALFSIGFFFAIAAFISFGSFPLTDFVDNQFTLLNISFWLLALFFIVRAFWQKSPPLAPPASGGRTRTLSSWTLLILAASAIIIFFRLYQTGTVPAEPFSDHAEKILDVYEITLGKALIFFPRNTGREALQMYWTLFVAKVFGTGFSYLSLKIGTALLGLLTLPYIYLLGKEVANKRVGLLAFFMFGIAYWPNVISRVGLRFPLYPLFVAPTLFYLLRGIRRQNRNDFILAGIFLGLGSHGYSPFRIMPFVVIAALGLYLLHKQSQGIRKQAINHLVILAFISLIVFLPLGRYALSNPEGFSYRAFSRLGAEDGNSLSVFASNFVDGLEMFNWDNGGIWVHSVAGRPALDVVSGALFLIGILLLILRYARTRHWLDLFLLLSIPLLQLPSTLSVAFPEENPALNRAGGAAVVVFVIVAIAFDSLLASLRSGTKRNSLSKLGWAVTGILLIFSMGQNYDLVFDKYATQFKLGAWNSSEMGQIIQEFDGMYGRTDTVWIVPFPHWVDTRLPGVWAGIPNRDFALWPENFAESLTAEAPKLFMLKPEDTASLAELQRLYPQGIMTRFHADVGGHDFLIFNVR
ncbi:MAG: hypothetical protein HN855_03700 [Anaerolineae bacterium]|jgi:hypothetical protein|nr:hypothetical protein [Anaerolineae bacterium]MBT7072391.1 hypothetical protein [Anaerolineae bacterium]MBT7324238.1 hypothetical protein [Anaerolineae bacterium]